MRMTHFGWIAASVALVLTQTQAKAAIECFKNLKPDTVASKSQYENCHQSKELIDGFQSVLKEFKNQNNSLQAALQALSLFDENATQSEASYESILKLDRILTKISRTTYKRAIYQASLSQLIVQINSLGKLDTLVQSLGGTSDLKEALIDQPHFLGNSNAENQLLLDKLIKNKDEKTPLASQTELSASQLVSYTFVELQRSLRDDVSAIIELSRRDSAEIIAQSIETQINQTSRQSDLSKLSDSQLASEVEALNRQLVRNIVQIEKSIGEIPSVAVSINLNVKSAIIEQYGKADDDVKEVIVVKKFMQAQIRRIELANLRRKIAHLKSQSALIMQKINSSDFDLATGMKGK